MGNVLIPCLMHIVMSILTIAFLGKGSHSNISGILVAIVLFLIPSTGLWAYYEHSSMLFYIISIISTVLWVALTSVAFGYTPVFGIPLLVVPFITAFMFSEPDGYNYLLLAGSLSGYMTFMFLGLLFVAVGHWSN